MKKVMKKILHVLAFAAVFAAATAVVMCLWNALIPSIIGWSAINYCQAAGLMILSRFLFGGFGGGHRGRKFWGGGKGRGCCRGGGHHHHHGDHARWHEKLRDEMQGMSREERRDFIRQRMREEHENHTGFGSRDRSFGGSEPHHHREDEQQ